MEPREGLAVGLPSLPGLRRLCPKDPAGFLPSAF
jgi:hypothetical protein